MLTKALPWLVLLLIDGALGWMNFHATDDVQAVAAGLMVAGFGFALWRPRLVWLTVPLLWLSIPISGAVADAYNYHPGLVKPAPLYETLVALIPAVLGAGLGAGARWISSRS